MDELSHTSELLADRIFEELRSSFLSDLMEEDNVTEFLVAFSHIAAGSDVSVADNIFSPRTHRLACAYKAATECFMELDELTGFEQFIKEELEASESQTAPDTPQMHQKILEFPVDVFGIPEEGDDG
tara:strand:- start:62 stop:442 length:381 start_codon:yes stop_codon:yes gene_type:complete